MKKLSLLLLLSVFVFCSCGDDDDDVKNEVVVSFENLLTGGKQSIYRRRYPQQSGIPRN